jgi:hypothetical protein
MWREGRKENKRNVLDDSKIWGIHTGVTEDQRHLGNCTISAGKQVVMYPFDSCNMTRHDMTRHDTTRHDATWRDATRRDTTRHDTIRCNVPPMSSSGICMLKLLLLLFCYEILIYISILSFKTWHTVKDYCAVILKSSQILTIGMNTPLLIFIFKPVSSVF